jgi:lipopolysaccharide transport system ATP-binding protein
MSDTVIKVENVSKKFTKSYKRLILYGGVDILKDFLGLKTRSEKLRKGEFWALNNISFELKKGETLGIIGINGSGKTTLLKLINGIFMPDKGRISVKGRVGALISVGAGFHPMLTGRENIYVNGQILGMTKKEIDKKFDQIVEFADIGDFIDAPVKHYSSGMHVRLGFSIAVHCEPEILLIDEILSVGDITFQKKASEKIDQIRKNTTTIFVSHSMRNVVRLCDRVILLNKGVIEECGEAEKVISYYINKNINIDGHEDFYIIDSVDSIKITKFEILDNNESVTFVEFNKHFNVEIALESKEDLENILTNITIYTVEGNPVTTVNNEERLFHIKKGINVFICEFENIRLFPGLYVLKIKISKKVGGLLVEAEKKSFKILHEKDKYIASIAGVYKERAQWRSET